MIDNNTPIREKILDANHPVEFATIRDAINDTVGTNYAGWMRACWPRIMGNGSFRLWFPKLAHYENGKLQAASFGCVNTLSSDGTQIVFDDLKHSDDSDTEYFQGYDLIFAKDPGNGNYIFRGVFVRNNTLSRPNHSVSDRVATKVLLKGKPADEIVLLS